MKTANTILIAIGLTLGLGQVARAAESPPAFAGAALNWPAWETAMQNLKVLQNGQLNTNGLAAIMASTALEYCVAPLPSDSVACFLPVSKASPVAVRYEVWDTYQKHIRATVFTKDTIALEDFKIIVGAGQLRFPAIVTNATPTPAAAQPAPTPVALAPAKTIEPQVTKTSPDEMQAKLAAYDAELSRLRSIPALRRTAAQEQQLDALPGKIQQLTQDMGELKNALGEKADKTWVTGEFISSQLFLDKVVAIVGQSKDSIKTALGLKPGDQVATKADLAKLQAEVDDIKATDQVVKTGSVLGIVSFALIMLGLLALLFFEGRRWWQGRKAKKNLTPTP